MDHKELDAWKKSMDLVEEVYQITKGFPSEERFGLIAQIRRSAISIPSNIAEGASRKSDKEFVQFLYISIGSLSELETQLLISDKLGYIQFDKIQKSLGDTKALIMGLIRYLRNK
jgi:four helix bundle protein